TGAFAVASRLCGSVQGVCGQEVIGDPCIPCRRAPDVDEKLRDWSPPMPQTTNRFFDDLSRLMTDAAGLADGARREVETFARTQMERMMAGMDIVSREEFEAVKEMAARARDENEKLAARVAALEARL